MINPNISSVIAIDGGGTRCRFALATGADRQIFEAGPANVYSDFEGAIDCINEGLRALAEQTGMALEHLMALPAFVGLAGITGPDISQRVSAALPLRHAHIGDDRRIAARGALGTKDGMIVHCGTGSFFASQMQGQSKLAGGWGAVLGDEASAQWVGRKALSAVLLEADGFLPRSPMIDRLLIQFSSTEKVLEFARTATPEEFGALAPIVTDCAQTGDAAALKILQDAAGYISAGLDQMGWTPDHCICLTGGIGPHYALLLPAEKRRALAKPLGSPLEGAILLAREAHEGTAHGYG